MVVLNPVESTAIEAEGLIILGTMIFLTLANTSMTLSGIMNGLPFFPLLCLFMESPVWNSPESPVWNSPPDYTISGGICLAARCGE
jgi:hypothetical protein